MLLRYRLRGGGPRLGHQTVGTGCRVDKVSLLIKERRQYTSQKTQ